MRAIVMLVVLVVTLMSGILSLVRELLAIYAPERVPPASLFWHCVWIAFIISAVVSWWNEHSQLNDLKISTSKEIERLTKQLEYDRPGIVLHCDWVDHMMPTSLQTGFHFRLENTNEHVAVNVSALDVRIPIPPFVLKGLEEETRQLENAFGSISSMPLEKEWIVMFDTISSVSRTKDELLRYRLSGKGPLIQNIATVFPDLIDKEGKAVLSLVLEFSNTGDPMRTWHAHYDIHYRFGRKKELAPKLRGYSEVNENRKCSLCNPL
jgi:hypothetical protein